MPLFLPKCAHSALFMKGTIFSCSVCVLRWYTLYTIRPVLSLITDVKSSEKKKKQTSPRALSCGKTFCFLKKKMTKTEFDEQMLLFFRFQFLLEWDIFHMQPELSEILLKFSFYDENRQNGERLSVVVLGSLSFSNSWVGKFLSLSCWVIRQVTNDVHEATRKKVVF